MFKEEGNQHKILKRERRRLEVRVPAVRESTTVSNAAERGKENED